MSVVRAGTNCRSFVAPRLRMTFGERRESATARVCYHRLQPGARQSAGGSDRGSNSPVGNLIVKWIGLQQNGRQSDPSCSLEQDGFLLGDGT